MSDLVRIFDDPESARRTVLRRRSWDQIEITSELAAGIRRIFGESLTPDQVVARILDDVRQSGDAAVHEYSQRIDGASPDGLRVREDEIEDAWNRISEDLRQALRVAADRVRAFHDRQYRQSWVDWDDEGGALGQIIRPLERVGIYAPGGRAPRLDGDG